MAVARFASLAATLSLVVLAACGSDGSTSGETRTRGPDPDDPDYDVGFDFWTPPSSGPFGEPGWRDTEQPFCRTGHLHAGSAIGVAFGEDTVFLLVPESDYTGRPEPHPSVWFNRGDGWAPLGDAEIYGGEQLEWIARGWLAVVDGEVLIDTSSGTPRPTPFHIAAVGVDAESGRVVATNGERLFEWREADWVPWLGAPPPFGVISIAISDDTVFVGGLDGFAASTDEGWLSFEGTGGVGAVAAHPRGAIAVGDEIGLFLATGEGGIEPIDAPRGPGHVIHGEELPVDRLVPLGSSTLVVADFGFGEVAADGTYREVGFWPVGAADEELVVLDSAAGPPGEAFFVVQHGTLECGEQVLWYDGAELHWF